MSFDDNDKRILRDAFKEALSDAGIGGNRFSQSSGSGGGGSYSGGGGGSGTTNLLDLDGKFGVLGSAVSLAGTGISNFTTYTGDSVKALQDLSKAGLSFNNNAIGMRDSIGQTRLSLDEYKSVMEKLSPSIAGLGGTVDQGAKNFNKFSGEFMNTDFAEQLTKMGYTTKDLNDVMAANMANRRFTDLSDDMQRKKAIEATANLAREMDETAKLTGITRQEQMADLKQRTENGKVQAAIQLEMIRGGKDVEQNYADMTKRLDGLGKGVKDLADEMFTGGVRTEEGAAKMAALGPAGLELQKAVDASKRAKTDEEKEAARIQMERAKAAVNERMKSEEFLQAVMVAGGKVGPAMQKMYEENKLRAGTTATENKTGQTTAQAMSTNQGAAVNQQQGRNEKGEADEGAKTTELYIQLMNRRRDIDSMVAKGANMVNDALVKIPATANMIDRALGATRSNIPNAKGENVQFTQGGIPGALDRVAIGFGTNGPPNSTTTPQNPNRPNAPPNLGNDGGKNPVNVIVDGLKDGILIAANSWFNGNTGNVKIADFLGVSTPEGYKALFPPRAGGSKDATGSWFENFGSGTAMTLHGSEAVVPKGKLGEFFKDMSKDMMGGMDVSNLAPQGGGLSQKDIEGELKKMMGDISPNMSQKPGEMNQEQLASMVKSMSPDMSQKPGEMNQEQIEAMTKSMKSMSPESLLEMVRTSSNEQMQALANKVYNQVTAKPLEPINKLKTASPGKAINPETGEEYTPIGDTKSVAKVAPKATTTAAPNPILELQKQLAGMGAKIKTDGIMGPETMAAIKANMSSMVRDTAKKSETPPAPPPPAPVAKTETPTTMPGTSEATLSDVVKSLESLNMLMGQLTAHAAETAEHSSATVKATKGLSGNLYAR